MERELVAASLRKLSSDEKMTSSLRIKLQAHVLLLAPNADMFSIPFAAMTTAKAFEIAASLILDEWSKDESLAKKYISSVKHEPLVWSAEFEKRNADNRLTESEILSKYSGVTNEVLLGQAYRKRDLQKEKSKAFSTKVQEPRGFTPSDEWGGCTLFTRVPSSKIILGYKKNQILIGSDNPNAAVETSIRDADYIDCEIVPCGAIVVTIGIRNSLSGGLAKQESLAFRLDEQLSLVPYSLTAAEALEAEEESEKRLQGETAFDFAENSCPLSAQSSFAKTEIIIGDKIIYETKGTLKHLCGAPNDFWLVFVTDVALHVKDGNIVESKKMFEKFFI